MRATPKSFEFVPSVQRRVDIPAPMAAVPALPVRLESDDGPAYYGLVDTGAHVSMMASSIAATLGWERRAVGSKIMATPVGTVELDLIKLTLILCDKDFSPWLRLRDVPFALVPRAQLGPLPDLVLGLESCLTKLHLTFDMARGRIRVSAPAALLASAGPKTRAPMPSRIIEASRLIKLGSHGAAVALIAAGLEEAILEHLGMAPEPATLGQLRGVLAERRVPARYEQRLGNIARLRNKAVHGRPNEFVTQEEAMTALRDARALIRHLSASDVGGVKDQPLEGRSKRSKRREGSSKG